MISRDGFFLNASTKLLDTFSSLLRIYFSEIQTTIVNIRHYSQNSKATSIRENRELFISSLTLCYSTSFITSLTWSTQLATLPGKMGVVLTESFVLVAQFMFLFCHLLTWLYCPLFTVEMVPATLVQIRVCIKSHSLQTLHEKLRVKKSVPSLLMSR